MVSGISVTSYRWPLYQRISESAIRIRHDTRGATLNSHKEIRAASSGAIILSFAKPLCDKGHFPYRPDSMLGPARIATTNTAPIRLFFFHLAFAAFLAIFLSVDLRYIRLVVAQDYAGGTQGIYALFRPPGRLAFVGTSVSRTPFRSSVATVWHSVGSPSRRNRITQSYPAFWYTPLKPPCGGAGGMALACCS